MADDSKRKLKPTQALQTPSDPIAAVLGGLTDIQRSVINDKSRSVLARCSRRAGKTDTDAAKLIVTALRFAGDTSVYFGLTKDSAKEAIWDMLLKKLTEHQIAHTYSELKLEITLYNGSRIVLIGADLQNIKDRLRGRKYRLVIVDECAFYSSVDGLILDVLRPTLADFKGQLYMTSSPGILPKGLFFRADQGDLKDNWSRYHWTGADNPLFQQPADNPKYQNRWEEELDLVCRESYNGDRTNPSFRREWLGEWVFDDRSLVYPLKKEYALDCEKNVKGSEYAIGINFSRPGKQGAVVVKYGEYTREVQVVKSYTFKSKNLDELAREIDSLIDEFDSSQVFCYLGDYKKDVLDDFRYRYKLPVIAGQYEKSDFYQQIVATDMENGHILALKPDSATIIDEWAKIVKDDHGQEIDNQDTLLADAFFVTYLAIYNMHLKQIEEEPTEEKRMEQELIESARRELEENQELYGYEDNGY